MKLLSRLKEFFFLPGYDLNNAIESHDMKLFLNLLKSADHNPKSSINGYGNEFPPLVVSFISNAEVFTVKLLALGADPNLKFTIVIPDKSVDRKEKIIQFPVNQRKASCVKLLALYGATSHDVYFYPDRLHLKTLIDEKYQTYQQRISLEEALKKDLSLHERVRIYTDLSELWKKQCADEQVPTYLAHYQEMSAHYQKKIVELNTDRFEYKTSAYPQFYPPAEQKSLSSKTNDQEELEPLLKANDSSKLKIS